MAERAVTLEELQKMLGKEGTAAVVEIEKGMIRKFADAIGDPNPLWRDEDYASKSRHGGITAPQEMFCCSMLSGGATRPDVPMPFKRGLDGGGEWEFFLPLRPADVITSTTKFSEVSEREGKLGTMVFQTFETTHKNQRGETVAKSRGTVISY